MTAFIEPHVAHRSAAPVAIPRLRALPERHGSSVAIPVVGPRREPASTYRRRRLVAAAIAAALLALAVWLMPSPAGNEASHSVLGDVSAVVVVVEPGETLWGIARDLQPSGDVRPLVDALSGIVGSSSLQAGQEIRIPADLLGGG